MINVSLPFLPPEEEYKQYISQLWKTKWLTNNGVLVQELEKALEQYLGIDSLCFVSNGTVALQLAIKALDIKGEIITTPFSFVATTTSIIWESCKPVFVDIDPRTLCIDVDKIEDVITDKTEAILATHVFGIPCDVERIEKIAKKFNLKVIYDAAHAFGVRYKERSLLSFGDISTISFHSTKLYHTVEGGAIANNVSKDITDKIKRLRSFGIEGDIHYLPGINAKNSEFHAAMGLCNLKYIDEIIEKRKKLTETYNIILSNLVERPSIAEEVIYNYSYYPVILKTEQVLLKIKNMLEEEEVRTKRYFYPSLNTLPYLKDASFCPVSEHLSRRILCLPLYSDLEIENVERIGNLIKNCLLRL
ncbi:DegT/DnrJ/EryC1/StrS family aminotransferase [Domibacillus sp.]|uniref:DegT/DnrJ/EryC1/StrS family aminotransferase n=1 Tax=Domibacillus sp. TaxID=1969783 RepID=UPI002810CEB9|nr:DegT/DnrJ/EryC1/StrS family aminotransferase [Domibacillus sp.]